MKKSNNYGLLSVTFFGIIFCLSSFFSFSAKANEEFIENKNLTIQNKVSPKNNSEILLSFSPLVKKAKPAVVNIYAKKISNRNSISIYEFFWGKRYNAPRYSQSLGSGVIVDKTGYIVTNNHVVEHADEIKVILSDKRQYDAEIISSDPRSDISILKIKGDDNFPIIPLGDSDDLEVGDLVLAIGNPFGVGQTVTSGIVSALARQNVVPNEYEYFIQTDASINVGNSGGALIDMHGDLIGINSAIYSRTGESNGIGFAIPINLVKQVINYAKNNKELIRPWLGAKADDIDYNVTKYLKLDRPQGALITDVHNLGPAFKAGLKTGDLILSINGKQISDVGELNYIIATQEIGNKVDISYLRDGKKRKTSVYFSELPYVDAKEYKIVKASPFYGVTIGNLSPNYNYKHDFDLFEKGVGIIDIESNSYALRYGIKPGLIITELNNQTIKTTEDVKNIVENWDSNLWYVKLKDKNGKTYSLRLQ